MITKMQYSSAFGTHCLSLDRRGKAAGFLWGDGKIWVGGDVEQAGCYA